MRGYLSLRTCKRFTFFVSFITLLVTLFKSVLKVTSSYSVDEHLAMRERKTGVVFRVFALLSLRKVG